jgi:diaminopimelate epimerase
VVRLVKAHGLGNDFLLARAEEVPSRQAAWAVRLCDRHLGVGADGLILYRPGGDGPTMRLLNADGGEAEISGNGLRCLAAHCVHAGLFGARHTVQTAAGPRQVDVEALGPRRYRIATDLGEPILDSASIPLLLDVPRAPVLDLPVRVAGEDLLVTATSLGNPHCAVFVDELPGLERLARLGRALETHPLFPRRTNVEFVRVASRSRIEVRFWERGAGHTRSSGTGAASAAVAAMLHDRVDREVEVACEGGCLTVAWPAGGRVRQVGEVELLFEADWPGELPA